MPARLKDECEKVKWRIRVDDLALLEVLYREAPGGVNGAVRAILHSVCERLKRELPKG